MPVRIFCLVLMAALSANSLLAAVSTASDCHPQHYCCCMDDRTNMSTAFAAEGGRHSCCCNPEKTTPCNMSAAPLSSSPLALIPASAGSPQVPNPVLLKESQAAVFPSVSRPSFARDILGSAHPRPALYLTICRLIC